MKRFDIAILVAAGRVRLLHRQLIVIHQAAVAAGELSTIGEVVDRGAQAIGLVDLGHSPQLPQRVLESFAEAFKVLPKADRAGLPIGVCQHEVVQQVREGCSSQRDAQFTQIGEV